ncbi:hypothetical protein [Lacisediminihabitans sp.]|jgi:predicted acyltransferase|uniref:hypothetical protein n=1 Tax=Lacisediminihabitans sp. TaxID=2787631 RepID=UPI002F9314CB
MRAGAGVEREESNARSRSAPESARNLAIDRFRGVLVILMVGGDYVGGVQIVPASLKHAPEIGFIVAYSK